MNLTRISAVIFSCCLISIASSASAGQGSQNDGRNAAGAADGQKWVGTWSTAPQLVEPQNNPPSPGLSNNTLRQIVHVSIGGDTLRMRFTNEFSTSPVTMNSVYIAVSKGGGAIDTTTDTPILFNGKTNVTMAADSAVMSDPFYFHLQPLSNVAITIYFGGTSPDVSGHPGSRTTSYLLTGDHGTQADFSGAVTTEHWYVINTVDVKAPDSAYAVAILGNSITDGRGSGTNKQDRWPDELSNRFQANTSTRELGVLNEGIGGNCVLRKCLGPSGLSRFQRDILDQSGVKWLIILEGINDIGGGGAGVGNELISAFKELIAEARAKGIVVYGATLLPMKGSFYYSDVHEKEREILNSWIQDSGAFDGVIDFDKALRNPADTLSLLPGYDSGDHLHPNEAGHHMMGEAVDLSLFSRGKATSLNTDARTKPNTSFFLQNYPNPFNPSTTVGFTLPVKAYVTLRVFDSLGREISTLISEIMLPGSHSKQWNAAGLPSGTYFACLQAGLLSETKKLVLLK